MTDLPEDAAGNQVSFRSFARLLGDGKGIETGESVDIGSYIGDEAIAVKALEKTAVIHGTVKYRTMFSTTGRLLCGFLLQL